MKFKFYQQGYQTAAVKAISDVFAGQPYKDASQTLYNRDLGLLQESRNGFANGEIDLSDDQLLENIQKVQGERIKHSKALSNPLAGKGTSGNICRCRCSLDIDMETGTGKTYVYTKAIFELNKRYGWSKFIVVVPSVAIREGAIKSLEQTKEHFKRDYKKEIKKFIYDSGNLKLLDDFSKDPRDIQVMIINSQAFNSSINASNARTGKIKAARIIYDERDDFASRRPIDVIADTRPIIILDEPQSLSGDKTQEGIRNFNPLFIMNFSATHRFAHNLIYVLDARDAYLQKLVKRIEVKGFSKRHRTGSGAFLHLNRIFLSSDSAPEAELTFEVQLKSGGIVRKSRRVKKHDDVWKLSGELEQYHKDYVIEDINADALTFRNGKTLALDDVVGTVEDQYVRRVQIRETILSHLQKEEKLLKRGIKCLSLFFIDRVINYRKYDEDNTPHLGDYGIIFEEEYVRAVDEYKKEHGNDDSHKEYLKYLESIDVSKTHAGYFSIDKKTGRFKDSKDKRRKDDEKDEDNVSTYDLIMRDKERLLSLEEKTRFIFSHSTLKEGWDNPNVFQICTLKESDSDIAKRQEVGRGMRLCVDSEGNRTSVDTTLLDGEILDGQGVHELNVLTVVATESYEEFAGGLQRNIMEDLYDCSTKATAEYFEGKIVKIDGEDHSITDKEAQKIMDYLKAYDYIDDKGYITAEYERAESEGKLAPLLGKIAHLGDDGVRKLIKALYEGDPISGFITRARNGIDNKPNKENFKKFQEIWKRINHKYAYTVSFDSAELVKEAVDKINDGLNVSSFTFVVRVGSQKEDDVQFSDGKTQTVVKRDISDSMTEYDLVEKIAKECTLKRKTVHEILTKISQKKFDLYKRNPEEFIQEVARIINEQKAKIIVKGVSYDATTETFEDDIFTSTVRLSDLLKWKKGEAKNKSLKDLVREKHITPYLVTDSYGEETFADQLDDATEVCVYAKLPRAFKIPTPVGDYAPDWAISFCQGTVRHIYFVAETKGSLSSLQLRGIEEAKIKCVKKLFDQLLKKLYNGEVVYDAVDSFDRLMDLVTSE